MTAQNLPRVALVTGASGGIGKAVVQKLASEGYALAVHYAGNQSTAEALVKEVTAAGNSAITVTGDIADETAMQNLFDQVEQQLGGVDVVVNTAGIMILAPIADYSLDDFDRVIRTNIRGTFVVSQQAARRVRPGGAIINFSTSVTRTQFPNYGPYVASKAAVEGMTLILARELRSKNITVNAVAPGPTATALFLDGKSEQAIQNMANAAPPGASRTARRHRGDGGSPRRARPLDQRADHLRQRWSHLSLTAKSLIRTKETVGSGSGPNLSALSEHVNLCVEEDVSIHAHGMVSAAEFETDETMEP